jgi:hypothetical protein
MTTIKLDFDTLTRLDLSPVETVIQDAGTDQEQQVQFEIDFPREENDPRELSEIPEIRLWFVRLDGKHPQMPFFLDWKAGELVRYAAMLVPHQFNRTEGIIFNPEALEIFVMQKVFVLTDWLKQQNLPYQSRLKAMTQLFGYELDEAFFAQL